MFCKLRKIAFGLMIGCSMFGIGANGCVPAMDEICASATVDCAGDLQNIETEAEWYSPLKTVAIR